MRRAAIIVFAAILASFAGFAATEYDVMIPSNTLGVVKVTSAAEYLPLAIGYGAVSAGSDAEARADGLIMTSNLVAGDELFVYDHESGKYDVFGLEKAEDGTATWKSRKVVEISNGGVTVEEGTAAADTVLAPGYGCWLHRPGVASRDDKTVTIIGQVFTGKITVTIAAASGTKAFGQTLIGPPVPSTGDFHLNGGSIDWTGAVKGDEIRLAKEDGTYETVKYTGSKWIRYYYAEVSGLNTLYKDYNPVIPAGQAAWYARKAGNPSFNIEMEVK